MKNLLIGLLALSLSLNAGAGSFSGPPYVPGNVTIQGGTIDNTPIGSVTPSTGSFTTLDASGTVSGTGFSNYLKSPPAIGSTTAGSGAFTTLAASGQVSGLGFSDYLTNRLASPGPIGSTTPAAGSFTTMTTGGTTGFTLGTIISLGGKSILMNNAAPTISSGFGTTPSITANNGSAVFLVNVGTGGTASSGVIGFNPPSTNGWHCEVSQAVMTANQQTIVTASTTTSVTVTNYLVSTAAVQAWTASRILRFICMGY